MASADLTETHEGCLTARTHWRCHRHGYQRLLHCLRCFDPATRRWREGWLTASRPMQSGSRAAGAAGQCSTRQEASDGTSKMRKYRCNWRGPVMIAEMLYCCVDLAREMQGGGGGYKLYSAFRNLFPKLCLILKEWFFTRFPPNFQERFLMSSASPEFVFGGPKIKQFCFKQV